MAALDRYLKMAQQVGASDVHIAVGSPPLLRLHGLLRTIKHPPLKAEETSRMFDEILTAQQRKVIEEEWELDFSYESSGVGRCPGECRLCSHK